MPGCFLMAGIFLSTPSARRATYAGTQTGVDSWISIHALREEGDRKLYLTIHQHKKFLSTPSARRAPPHENIPYRQCQHFYPRPPRGGRHYEAGAGDSAEEISIHALREEGDTITVKPYIYYRRFLSTPSARRATRSRRHPRRFACISIHALREEGDAIWRSLQRSTSAFLSPPSARRATDAIRDAYNPQLISIHALREEGDTRMAP